MHIYVGGWLMAFSLDRDRKHCIHVSAYVFHCTARRWGPGTGDRGMAVGEVPKGRTHWFDATWIARAMVDLTRPSSSVSRPAIVHPPGAIRVGQLGGLAYKMKSFIERM